MLIITKDNLIDKIHGHEFKTAVVYDRQFGGKDPMNQPYFERYDENSPDELVEKIRKFDKTYPGVFLIALKKSSGGINSALVNVQFGGASGQTTLNGTTGSSSPGFESQDQMRARLLEEIKTGMELQRLRAELASKDAKLQGLETTGGKLANMIEMWIEAKFLGKKVPNLQGTGDTPGDEQKVEVNQVEIEKAMRKLLDVLRAETMIKLSKKLNAGDPVLQMVIDYANN